MRTETFKPPAKADPAGKPSGRLTGPPPATAPEIITDLTRLPPPVARMRARYGEVSGFGSAAGLGRAAVLDEGIFAWQGKGYPVVVAEQDGQVVLSAWRVRLLEAIDTAGEGYLLPRVAMAKFLLTEPKDRKERHSLLEAVLSAPRDAFPENRLANEVARRRAARYLEARD